MRACVRSSDGDDPRRSACAWIVIVAGIASATLSPLLFCVSAQDIALWDKKCETLVGKISEEKKKAIAFSKQKNKPGRGGQRGGEQVEHA